MLTGKRELSLPAGMSQLTNAVLLGLSVLNSIVFGQVVMSNSGGVISVPNKKINITNRRTVNLHIKGHRRNSNSNKSTDPFRLILY